MHRPLATLLLPLVLAAFARASTPGDAAPTTTGFRHADTPRTWTFPRDHGSHPDYATEWWYFTGSLVDVRDQNYGFELTFFRVGLQAQIQESTSPWRARDLVIGHLAITDVDGKRFFFDEVLDRAAAGFAGADTTGLDVFVGPWRARAESPRRWTLRANGRDGEHGFSLDLELFAAAAPVLHGEEGLSFKSRDRSQASYYYSLPRLPASGRLVLDDQSLAVSGVTWMDHEFFTGRTPEEGLGWDWFSARLDDGRDLMLYRIRDGDRIERLSGTLVEPDGRVRMIDVMGAELEVLRAWSSPETGARYPVEWKLELPAEALALWVRPVLDSQEVRATDTVGFAYWEGLCLYEGTADGRPVHGEGYVELTGYDRPPASRP